MSHKNCSHCGHPNPLDNKYCSECGAVFRNMAPIVAKAHHSTPKHRLWLPIVLLLLLVCGAAVMVLRNFAMDLPPVTNPSETACRHEWSPATCTSPQFCHKCGKTSGTAMNHNWASATCTEAKYCSVCGLTSGSAVGHQWVDATYSAPKTCSVCGRTEGKPLENPLVEHLQDRLPIVTYAMTSTRKVYGYEDSELTRKSDSRYLEPNAGEIVISDITDDGSALKVTFHSKSTPAGYDTLWFPFEDILQIQDVDIRYQTARVYMDTYKPVHSSFVITRYGGMDSGWDFCYLGSHESGYFVITYRVFEQKIHGFSVYDKIALVKTRP